MFVLLLATTVYAGMYANAQCAMCKASAEAASSVDRSIGEQVNSGILYLMIIPYIVFFIFFRKKIRSLLKQLKEAARH
jgi:hypothetical protein